MDIALFREVFNNLILNKIVFQQVHHIFKDILRVKKIIKWNEVLKSRYILAGNGYLSQLKEYYRINNRDDLKYNRKPTVLLHAFKSNSLDIIKYLFEELNYNYNSYGCYDGLHLKCKGHDILYIASKYCNIDIVKYIDSLRINNNISNNNNNNSSDDDSTWNYIESFKVAPLSNDIKVLQYIYNKAIENNQIPDEYHIKCSISKSLSVGRIDFVQWLFTLSKTLINLNDIEFIKSAIKSGKLHILQYCMTNFTLHPEIINLIEYAAIYGSLDIIKWLYSNNIGEISDLSYENASNNKHWNVVEWLYQNSSNRFRNIKTLLNAALDGQVDIYRKLFKEDIFSSMELFLLDRDSLVNAATNGSLGMIQWLLQNRTESDATFIIDCAAEFVHLDIVKWLHHNRSEGCTTNAIDNAALLGNFEIIKWLHYNRSEGCTSYAMDNSAWHGDLEIVKWFHENRTEGCTAEAVANAARNGHLEIIKWLYENRTEVHSANAIDSATLSGDLEVVKWLHNQNKGSSMVYGMNYAASNGNFEILKWLHSNLNKVCTKSAMDLAAMKGHIEILKWLHENRTEGCSPAAMNLASLSGHLDIVKWLHENRTEGCTSCAMNFAAEHGNLEMVKWLHENRTEGCTDKAMENAASNGNLEMVKWLHENRTEGIITVAIQRAAANNHFEIIKWISSLP